MSNLLPCPFCGHDDQIYPAHRWPGTGAPYAVDCVRCGYDFVPRLGMDVAAMWNTRADALTPQESQLLRMVEPGIQQRSREPGDAWDQASALLRRLTADARIAERDK